MATNTSTSTKNSQDKILEKLQKVVDFAMETDMMESDQSGEEFPDVLIPEEVIELIESLEQYKRDSELSQERMREINQIYHKLQRKRNRLEDGE
jgi:hypothetical protein